MKLLLIGGICIILIILIVLIYRIIKQSNTSFFWPPKGGICPDYYYNIGGVDGTRCKRSNKIPTTSKLTLPACGGSEGIINLDKVGSEYEDKCKWSKACGHPWIGYDGSVGNMPGMNPKYTHDVGC